MKAFRFEFLLKRGNIMKIKSMLMLSISTVLVLTMVGCSSPSSSSSSSNPSTSSSASTGSTVSVTSSGSTQKVFTAAELKKYNGQNGNPAYVAVDGVVYDVTNANKWNNGMHQGLTAGNDLSQAIKSSPHGTSILSSLPVVGKLQG